MNPQERDEEILREYLEGDSALSRLYRRDAREQPDAQLDARILAEARRAVSRKSRVAHSPFSRHWMVPASLAAVLLLSVSVVLLMPDPVRMPGVGIERAADSAPSPAAVVGSQATESARRREQESDAEQDIAGGRASEAEPRQSPVMSQPVDRRIGKASEKRKAVAAERDDVASDQAPLSSAAPAATGIAEMPLTPTEPSALGESTLGPGPMPGDDMQADPAEWLRFIESLVQDRNREAARINLRAFRARYPDFPLPSALMPLAASVAAEQP